ncbi:hypothetical protein EON65_45815 [archaeon]|nr:MAG: hypothetical protein EON65_45815 [archaeon]
MVEVSSSSYMRFVMSFVVVGTTLTIFSLMSVQYPYKPHMSQIFSRSLAADDDEFVYDNPYDTYSPNQWVKYGHMITGEDFVANQDYVKKAFFSPIITIGLGILSFVGLFFGLCSRCCCACAKCQPESSDPKYEQGKFRMTIIFYVLVLLVLVFDQLVFIGNTNLDKGLSTIVDAVAGFNDILTNLYDSSVVLLGYGSDLDGYYDTAQQTCVAAASTDVSDQIDTFNDAIKAFKDILKPAITGLDNVQEHAQKEGTNYRNAGLYSVWSFGIASGLFFLLSQCIQSVCMAQFSIIFGVVTYLLFLLLGFLWMLMTSMFGDLCMKPTENIIMALPGKNDLKDLVFFYVSCIGDNVLQENIDDGQQEIVAMNDTINILLDPSNCPNNAALQNFQATLGQMSLEIDHAQEGMACPPMRDLWFQFINQGLCDETYTGLFYIWGSQLLTSFFLFLLCVTGSMIYQYYSNLKVSPADNNIVEGEEEEVEYEHGNKGDKDGDSPRDSPR